MKISNIEKNLQIAKTLNQTRLKRKNQICKVFTVKIQEDALKPQQKEFLQMVFLEAKWLVNHILNWSQESEENKIWEFKVDGLKKVQRKLRDGSFVEQELKFLKSQIKQEICAGIVEDIKSLLKKKEKGQKVGKLKFRKEITSIDLVQFGITWKYYDITHVGIQGMSGKRGKKSKLKVNGLSQIPSNAEFANAKLLKKPSGYYLAITTYLPKESKQTKQYKAPIGIDMGCQTSLTLSTGEKINVSIKESERLKRLQRKHARQYLMNPKGSNNRKKTLHLIKIEYEKQTNKKNDLANKVIKDLLEHEIIFMQNENLKGWKKKKRTKKGKKLNHLSFGRQIQSSILGRVKSKLKGHERVVVVNQFEPTSKTCLQCGFKNEDLKLSDRNFKCSQCGFEMDRDIHAAQNMIKFGKKQLIGQGLSKLTPIEIEALHENSLRNFNATLVGEVGTQIKI